MTRLGMLCICHVTYGKRYVRAYQDKYILNISHKLWLTDTTKMERLKVIVYAKIHCFQTTGLCGDVCGLYQQKYDLLIWILNKNTKIGIFSKLN